MDGTVWTDGGCASWYLDATGRNSVLWPGYVTGFRLRLPRFRAGDYVTTGCDMGAQTSLTGQRALITGPAQGIGERTASWRPPAVRGSD